MAEEVKNWGPMENDGSHLLLKAFFSPRNVTWQVTCPGHPGNPFASGKLCIGSDPHWTVTTRFIIVGTCRDLVLFLIEGQSGDL